MGILKEIAEGVALVEVSKNLLRNYIKGAQKDLNNHPEGSAKFDSRVDNGLKAIDKVEGPNISKTTRGPKCPGCGSDENSGVRAYKVAGDKGPWMSQCTKCAKAGKKSWFHDNSHYCVESFEQLDEISKGLASRYKAKAMKDADHHDDQESSNRDKMYNSEVSDEPELHAKFRAKALTHNRKLNNRLTGAKRANKILAKEETEQIDEANVNQAAAKLATHGYKKFGDSDKVDSKSVLSHFHNEKTGHMICVDHHPFGKINSASTLKCTNTKTGEMESSWGKEHKHVEHALQELGHKSYIGFNEEEIQEGNSANKEKKNAHVASVGAKSLHIDSHKDAHFRASLSADRTGSSKEHATKNLVGSMKRAGRQEINHPSPKETYHAHYDSTQGVYHIKHTASGKIVDHNVSDSGGRALSIAANWNHRAKIKESIEEAIISKKRGRPRKARHEDGEIVNDPKANS